MRDFIKLPLMLFLIALIAGALLGVTNALTKEPIQRQNELALENARIQLFANNEFSEVADSPLIVDYENVQKIYMAKSGGQISGYIITLTTKGYGGDVLINVGVTTDGKLTGLIVGTNSETPGLGAKASEIKFSGQFAGKSNIELVKGEAVADNEVSAITAATITSQAIVDGVNQAIEISSKVVGGK